MWGILLARKSPDYPGYDLKVRGDAVYQNMGGGKYSYRKFREISNRYLGLREPTHEEITNILSTDWKKFYRAGFQKIIKIMEPLDFTKESYFYWHNLNPVELTLKTKVESVETNVETKIQDQVY